MRTLTEKDIEQRRILTASLDHSVIFAEPKQYAIEVNILSQDYEDKNEYYAVMDMLDPSFEGCNIENIKNMLLEAALIDIKGFDPNSVYEVSDVEIERNAYNVAIKGVLNMHIWKE